MKKLLNWSAQTGAWLRHATTAAASIVAILSVLAGLDADTSAKLLAAIKQALGGLTDLLTGLAAVATIVMAFWARWTAKPDQQIAAVNALPGVAVVSADPSVSGSSPPVTIVRSPALLSLVLLGACLLLAACGTNSTGQATFAGADKLPGTNVAVADVADQLSVQCDLRVPTWALVDAVLAGFGMAFPGGVWVEAGAKSLASAGCAYLTATTGKSGSG